MLAGVGARAITGEDGTPYSGLLGVGVRAIAELELVPGVVGLRGIDGSEVRGATTPSGLLGVFDRSACAFAAFAIASASSDCDGAVPRAVNCQSGPWKSAC